MTLEWRNIDCWVRGRHLLQGISGTARRDELTAIMAPSGGGKTTLIRALSHRLRATRGMRLMGEATLDDRGYNRRSVVFVEQENVFFDVLTVRETLGFYDALLGIRQREEILARFVLEKAVDTRVGALSGGERKRLAIAIELMTAEASPCIILDEPTTGLDGAQALKIIRLLEGMKTGRSIILTIHQPRPAILAYMDRFLFLREGRAVFTGTMNALEAVVGDTHPVDIFMDSISGDDASMFSVATEPLPARSTNPLEHAMPPSRASSWGYKPLLWRALRCSFRNRTAVGIKLGTNMFLAVVFGVIYHHPGTTVSKTIQNRIGFLFLSVLTQVFSVVAGMINMFVLEKKIVGTDLEKERYRVLPYFLTRTLVDVPFHTMGCLSYAVIGYSLAVLRRDAFLGFWGMLWTAMLVGMSCGIGVSCVSLSPEVATALITPLNVVFLVFAGVFVSLDGLPVSLRWLSWVSYIRWGFQGLLINDMRGEAFGEDVLRVYGFDAVSYKACLGILVLEFCAGMAIAYGLLVYSVPRFAPMRRKEMLLSV